MTERIELIAEVASNHGGSMAIAKRFIEAFSSAGADWIKFQATRIRHLRPNDPQYDWFAQAELSWEQFAELKAYTEAHGKRFLLTVYNAQDVPAAAQLGLEAIKIGSGEAQEWPLVRAAVATFPRVIGALGCIHQTDFISVANIGVEWLRCVTRYPAPGWMCKQKTYRWERGWSDHCVGIEVCERAIWKGARIIEKHVQLDQQARPVRPFEATVEEFKQLRAFADDDPSRFLGRWQHGG